MSPLLLVDARRSEIEALGWLEEWGYRVETAADPEGCRAALETEEPGAVLLVMDPGGAWSGCLQAVRKAAPRVPVVALRWPPAGRSQGDTAAEDFAATLGRSFRLEELVLAVETAACPRSGAESAQPLSRERRRGLLEARRRRVDERRLSDFLARRLRKGVASWQDVPGGSTRNDA